jgi:hypothetical protein
MENRANARSERKSSRNERFTMSVRIVKQIYAAWTMGLTYQRTVVLKSGVAGMWSFRAP